MDDLNMFVKTITNTCPGSGEGYGSIVDCDVVFDDMGLPYIPARRIKGVLRECALELQEMVNNSGLMEIQDHQLNKVFGREGQYEGASLIVTDLLIDGHDGYKEWFEWLYHKYPALFSPAVMMEYFTEMRRQTSITEQGIAEEGSLRTSRVLKKGLCFKGLLYLSDYDEKDIVLLALSCANLRHLGVQRNRGLGEVEVMLYKGNDNVTKLALQKLGAKGGKSSA